MITKPCSGRDLLSMLNKFILFKQDCRAKGGAHGQSSGWSVIVCNDWSMKRVFLCRTTAEGALICRIFSHGEGEEVVSRKMFRRPMGTSRNDVLLKRT